MSRAQRLLDLIQVLRQHRRAIAGAVLAEELGVSLRTVYRDIETLRAQGAHIEGEAGLGYVLRPGFMLPPLMSSEEEIDWQRRGLTIAQAPTPMSFGSTFVALDPDGHRLRVFAPPRLHER